MEKDDTVDNTDVELRSTKAARSRPKKQEPPAETGLGRNAYSDKYLAPILAQPLAEKGRISRNTWADTAYVLVLRAKRLSQTVGKKDFNALYRLILSAGIAYDKAWPQVETPSQGNILIQVFGAMPAEQVRSILQPPTPAISISPTVETTDAETT